MEKQAEMLKLNCAENFIVILVLEYQSGTYIKNTRKTKVKQANISQDWVKFETFQLLYFEFKEVKKSFN